jgi:hypothetical protein
MHTVSKLNATPRERMLELELRFPLAALVSRPTVVVALAGGVLAVAIGFIGWTAGRSMYGLYRGYADLLVESAAAKSDF